MLSDTTYFLLGAVAVLVAVMPGLAALFLYMRGAIRRIEWLEGQADEDKQEISTLRVEMAELSIGVGLLVAQVRRAGMEPEWTHTARSKSSTAPPAALTSTDAALLAQKIDAQFDVDEVNGLAFDLGIPPDELTGGTGAARARALVLYAKRRHKGNELIALCRAERPDGGF